MHASKVSSEGAGHWHSAAVLRRSLFGNPAGFHGDPDGRMLMADDRVAEKSAVPALAVVVRLSSILFVATRVPSQKFQMNTGNRDGLRRNRETPNSRPWRRTGCRYRSIVTMSLRSSMCWPAGPFVFSCFVPAAASAGGKYAGHFYRVAEVLDAIVLTMPIGGDPGGSAGPDPQTWTKGSAYGRIPTYLTD